MRILQVLLRLNVDLERTLARGDVCFGDDVEVEVKVSLGRRSSSRAVQFKRAASREEGSAHPKVVACILLSKFAAARRDCAEVVANQSCKRVHLFINGRKLETHL